MTDLRTRAWLVLIVAQAIALVALSAALRTTDALPLDDPFGEAGASADPIHDERADRGHTVEPRRRSSESADAAMLPAAVGCILSGTIRDASGRLVEQARVNVDFPDGRPVARTSQSDDRGYALLGLEPGRYVVTAQATASRPVEIELTVDPADRRLTRDFRLDAAAIVRVRLTDPSDRALPLTREAFGLGEPAYERPLVISVVDAPPGQRLADAHHQGRSPDVSWRPVRAAADYVSEIELTTDDPRYAVVTFGDLVLTSATLPPAGGEVTLVVDRTAVRAAIGAVEVVVHDPTGTPAEQVDVHLGSVRHKTDATGLARFDATPPGIHAVTVLAAGLAKWQTRVSVGLDAAVRIEARLEPRRVQRIRVVDPSGGPLDGIFASTAPRELAVGPAVDWFFQDVAPSVGGVLEVPLPTTAAVAATTSSGWRIRISRLDDFVGHVDVDADAAGDPVLEVPLRRGRRLVLRPEVAGWRPIVVRGADGLPIAWGLGNHIVVPPGEWTVERHDRDGNVSARSVTVGPGESWQVVELR